MKKRLILFSLLLISFYSNSQNEPKVFELRRNIKTERIIINPDSTFSFISQDEQRGKIYNGNYQYATGKIKKLNDSVFSFETDFMFAFYEMMRMYPDTLSVFVSDCNSKPVKGIKAEITRASGKNTTGITDSRGAIHCFVSKSSYVNRNAVIRIYLKENEILKKQFALSEHSSADVLVDYSTNTVNKFRIKENNLVMLDNGFMAVKGKIFLKK